MTDTSPTTYLAIRNIQYYSTNTNTYNIRIRDIRDGLPVYWSLKNF